MKRIALLAATLLGSFAFAPAAGAADGSTGQTGPSTIVNPGDPGSSQYQEDVPSAFGSVPARNISARAKGARIPSVGDVILPRSVTSTLAKDGNAGRAAAALAIAGTPTLEPTRTPGADHQRSAKVRSHHTHTPGPRHAAPVTTPTVPLVAGSGRSVTASVARSVFGSDGGLGGLLPVLLVVSAVFAVGVAVGRRRERSR